MSYRFANRIKRVKPSAIRELLRLGDDSSITSFGGGYPDPQNFPVEELRAVFNEVLTDDNRQSLQYTSSIGLPGLRARIADRARADGTECSADDVLILHGAQQGLDLVAKMLIDPGDIIVTENPTFLGALCSFDPYEPEYRPVETDQDGIDTDELERILKSESRVRFIYVIPDFQNPTGITMSLERRKRLLDLANEFDVIILEDSPYRALRYEGEDVPTIKSMDTEGRVIQLGSFSKTLAPGLRTGWAIAPQPLYEKLALLKLAADTQSSTVNMTAIQRFLETCDLDAQIASAQVIYRSKRDLMLRTMEEEFPSDISFTRPRGGLFTWVEFPEGFDAAAFMENSALPNAKVAYVPGGTFFPSGNRPNFARFSYSGVPEEEMVTALQRLGRLLHEELAVAAHS